MTRRIRIRRARDPESAGVTVESRLTFPAAVRHAAGRLAGGTPGNSDGGQRIDSHTWRWHWSRLGDCIVTESRSGETGKRKTLLCLTPEGRERLERIAWHRGGLSLSACVEALIVEAAEAADPGGLGE